MTKLPAIREKIAALQDESDQLFTVSETQDFSEDQMDRIDAIDAEMQALRDQELACERVERIRGRAAATADAPAEMNTPRQAGRRSRPDAGDSSTRISRMDHPLDRRGGFEHVGAYCLAVAQACAPGGQAVVDNRLTALMQPTNDSSTTVPAEGGYAVPPDFREAIRQALTGPESLMPRTDMYATEFQAITVPKDDKGPWGTTGPQANWTAEKTQIADSKVSIGQMTVKLEKLACLMPVTEELLQDAPGISSYINRKAPDVIRFKFDEAIVAGTGTGQPQGFIGHASEVAVNRATANQIKFADVLKMYERMPPNYISGAIWLCNSDVLPVLMNMSFQDNTTNPRPVWLPTFQMADSPYGTLMGRPVVLHEAMPALGSKGDLTFINLERGYFCVEKAGFSGLRQDISIHLYFDYDITSFRWILRVGGRPWLDAPIARAKAGNTKTWSHTVTLDVVAAGP